MKTEAPDGNLRVTWVIDIDMAEVAARPELLDWSDRGVQKRAAVEAAKKAHEHATRPGTIAKFYSVEHSSFPRAMMVDLNEHGGPIPGAMQILDEVIAAMQPAEEIGGPEGSDYVLLMAAVAAEANKRIRNYLDDNKVMFP